jgi:hypothetical protein
MATRLIESTLSPLPRLHAAREVRSQFRFGFDGIDQHVVPVPPGTESRLVEQLASTVERSILQIVLVGGRTQLDMAFAEAVWQSVASDPKRQVTIQRLYLFPPGLTGTDPAIDSQSGKSTGRIQVRYLPLRQITDQQFPLALTNLWLMDGVVVVSEELDAIPRWEVSARTIDIDRFSDTWKVLWKQASSSPPVADSNTLLQPLEQSADATAAVARMTCSQPLYDQPTCVWFHEVWQYLHLFDMVSTPDWHSRFFLHQLYAALKNYASDRRLSLASNASTEHPRILITGAADYTMLAYVLTANQRARTSSDVEVLDRCRTPLIACNWYARWSSENYPDGPLNSLTMHELDVLNRCPLPHSVYDLITTDAYLTRFEPSHALAVLQLWHQLLRPGGKVITTVRLHPCDAPRGALLDEVSDFTLRAQESALRWNRYLRIASDDLTAAAQRYVLSMRSYDLGDAQGVLDLFRSVGFRISAHEVAPARGELRPATYLRVVAEKLPPGRPYD